MESPFRIIFIFPESIMERVVLQWFYSGFSLLLFSHQCRNMFNTEWRVLWLWRVFVTLSVVYLTSVLIVTSILAMAIVVTVTSVVTVMSVVAVKSVRIMRGWLDFPWYAHRGNYCLVFLLKNRHWWCNLANCIRWWRSLPPSAVTMETGLLAYVAFSLLDVTAIAWTS